ncbi:SPOR domain-containing protein [Geofilum rubicundum]|uniref:Uncharacterized protein n=1 Tax=Geofilum rubicundum JCM 15548 TaxID=1236989 RepID=A0A0E9LYR2_9BACT|nr:SPOR domain-containing protein [Geofilum rubicundum]GAO30281.1 hypothetical protein JCM15548_12541 [Geofilum rubicundum JCM 15548]
MKLIRTFILTLFVFSALSAYGDKLAHLRSARKIVTVESITAPYYTIQVVALKEPPGNAAFFTTLTQAREFICTDGFVRYTIGEYDTFGQAARDLEALKAQGFSDVFVLNTRKISLKNSNQTLVIDKNAQPVAGVAYTIQVAALRYPVYVSEFEEFEDVQEYYMRDRIYRYCVGNFDGAVALDELSKVRQSGYPDAFLVPVEKYASFKIE